MTSENRIVLGLIGGRVEIARRGGLQYGIPTRFTDCTRRGIRGYNGKNRRSPLRATHTPEEPFNEHKLKNTALKRQNPLPR